MHLKHVSSSCSCYVHLGFRVRVPCVLDHPYIPSCLQGKHHPLHETIRLCWSFNNRSIWRSRCISCGFGTKLIPKGGMRSSTWDACRSAKTVSRAGALHVVRSYAGKKRWSALVEVHIPALHSGSFAQCRYAGIRPPAQLRQRHSTPVHLVPMCQSLKVACQILKGASIPMSSSICCFSHGFSG